MPNKDGMVQRQFDAADRDRQQWLIEATECAHLSDQSVLPSWSDRESLNHRASNNRIYRRNWQSLGSHGVNVHAAKLKNELIPSAVPWVRIELTPDVALSPAISQKYKQRMATRLMLHSAMVQDTLQTAASVKSGIQGSFDSAFLRLCLRFIVTGDALAVIEDDFTVRTYRNDLYVVKRDGTGAPYRIIWKERVDPFSLSDEMRAKAEYNERELAEQEPQDREDWIYTRYEYQYANKRWVLTRESGKTGKTIEEREERLCRAFPLANRLTEGEDHGRGLVARHLGDFRSLDALSEALVAHAAAVSKVTPVLDYNADAKEEDLARPSGEPIRLRVMGGQVQDAAMLQTGNTPELAATHQFTLHLRQELGRAFMLVGDSVRDAERTTAVEVGATLEEITQGTGSDIIRLTDQFLTPVATWVHETLQDRGIIRKLDPVDGQAVKVSILTGSAALSRRARAQGLLTIARVATELQAMNAVNVPNMLSSLARYVGVFDDGIIKSPEEMQRELEAAMQREAQMAATQQGIQSTGAVAEEVAMQALAPQ